jgi:hypothetical protein
MQHQEIPQDRLIFQRFIDDLEPSIQVVLQDCSVSFLKLLDSNVLLITWCRDDCISSVICKGMLKIAQAIQRHSGNTHICLRHYQKNITMRWSSAKLIENSEKKI